jgi:cell wall-associated NlpC family hydrolase
VADNPAVKRDLFYLSSMSLRAAGLAMSLVVAAGGLTEAFASAGQTGQTLVAEPFASASPAVTPTPDPTVPARAATAQPVWVSAGVATVWIKPGRTRKVDAPALHARPNITRWINRQSLRQRNDLGPRVMTQTLHGDKLLRLDRRDGWSKVQLPDQTGNKFPDGIVGWVPTKQLSTTRVRHAVMHDGVRPHGTGQDALRIARSYLGVRYLWAGLSREGIDCSGLTYRVFRSLGVVLPRDAADQSRVGTPVSRHDLRKGDLVFFGSGKWPQIHHVGFYAGHGLVLHAPYTGTTVQYTPLRLWSDYWGARRIR